MNRYRLVVFLNLIVSFQLFSQKLILSQKIPVEDSTSLYIGQNKICLLNIKSNETVGALYKIGSDSIYQNVETIQIKTKELEGYCDKNAIRKVLSNIEQPKINYVQDTVTIGPNYDKKTTFRSKNYSSCWVYDKIARNNLLLLDSIKSNNKRVLILDKFDGGVMYFTDHFLIESGKNSVNLLVFSSFMYGGGRVIEFSVFEI